MRRWRPSAHPTLCRRCRRDSTATVSCCRSPSLTTWGVDWTKILRLLDLTFLRQGANISADRQSWRWQNIPVQDKIRAVLRTAVDYGRLSGNPAEKFWLRNGGAREVQNRFSE